jgi:lipoprotein-anchoring transpeptidase ErfK/SrfK
VKYKIQSGDSLVKIAKRENLGVDWRFIQRINRMSDPGKLTVGQPIKLVRGPFHAVVSKGKFRLDLYQGAPPAVTGDGVVNTAGGSTVFVASFPVGLGEFGSTPIGAFMVKQGSKLVNPAWRNPRTGEQFSAEDPKNPIGERWVGLEGIEERTRSLTGYGLHGTIEPESIGTEKSMGCVRMLHDDIGLIYELMTEGASTVQIVP